MKMYYKSWPAVFQKQPSVYGWSSAVLASAHMRYRLFNESMM